MAASAFPSSSHSRGVESMVAPAAGRQNQAPTAVLSVSLHLVLVLVLMLMSYEIYTRGAMTT